jgi:DNA-binding transcriptional LysR family regulator
MRVTFDSLGTDILSMELRHLHHFIAVAEEQNFTRAAEMLCISQSFLSLQIRPFEKEIGSPLFYPELGVSN